MVNVGKVTENEKKEILSLFEKKNALFELVNILQINEETEQMYQRLLADMTTTTRDFNQWWTDMSEKYSWKKSEGGSWNIDFATNDIYLLES